MSYEPKGLPGLRSRTDSERLVSVQRRIQYVEGKLAAALDRIEKLEECRNGCVSDGVECCYGKRVEL